MIKEQGVSGEKLEVSIPTLLNSPNETPYIDYLAKDEENMERFIGNPSNAEKDNVERDRLNMLVAKMIDAPDEYLPSEHQAALEELNNRYTLTNQSLINFTNQFGKDSTPAELLRMYVDKINKVGDILSAPVGPRTEESAEKFNDKCWEEAMIFLGETFGDKDYLETKRAMQGMSQEEQAAYAKEWLVKNKKIDITDDTDFLFTKGYDATDAEIRAWYSQLDPETKEKVDGAWDAEMKSRVEKSFRDTSALRKRLGHKYGKEVERNKFEGDAEEYAQLLDSRAKWIDEQRYINRMIKLQTNERNFAQAMEIIPFMNNAQKQLVAAAAQGQDMNRFRGVFKLMDDKTRGIMEVVCNAVRPETEAGFISGLEMGGRRLFNSITEFTTAAYYQAFKEVTEQDKLAEEQRFNREFNTTLGWDKLKDPSGWWEKAWVGLGESMPLQGSAIGGALAFRTASKLAKHPLAKLGITVVGAILESMGLLSMAGDEYENLILNGVKREDAIPLAFSAGVGNWMIENMNTEMILGTGLSANELMRIGLVSSAKAGARMFTKKSIAQFGRKFLYREFMETIRSNAAVAFKIALSENFEEFVQGIVSKGVEQFAKGEKPLLTTFIDPETIEAGAQAFAEAMPTCTLFGLGGAIFPVGSGLGFNQNGARANAMLAMDEQLDALLDEKIKNLGLDTKGGAFVKEWKRIEKKRIENQAAQVVRGTDGMSPEQAMGWINKQNNMTQSERAFYADMVSFYNATRIQVGDTAAKAYVDSNLQLFRYEAGGAKVAIDPKTGKVTSVTFKDEEGDVTIGINDLTNENITRDSIGSDTVMDFINAWNEKHPDNKFSTDVSKMSKEELQRLDKAIAENINGFYSDTTKKVTLTPQAKAATLAHESAHATIWDALQNALDKQKGMSRSAIRRIKANAQTEMGISRKNDEATAELVELKANIEGATYKNALNYFESADIGAAVKNVGKWIANIFRSGKAKTAYLPVFRKANVEDINPIQLVNEVVNEALPVAIAEEQARQKKNAEDKARGVARRGENAEEVAKLRQQKREAKASARKEKWQAIARNNWESAEAKAQAEKEFWDEIDAEIAKEESLEKERSAREEAQKARNEERERQAKLKEEQALQVEEDRKEKKMLDNRKQSTKEPPRLGHAKNQDGETAQRSRAAYLGAWNAKMGKPLTQEDINQLGENYGLPPEALNLKKNKDGKYYLTDKQLLSDNALGKFTNELIKFYADIKSVKIIVPDVVVATAEEANNAVPNEVYDPVSDTFIVGRIVVDAEKAKTFRVQAGMEEPSISINEIENGKNTRFSISPVYTGSTADYDKPSLIKVGWNYVSSRDDNIRIDHKWVNGTQRFSLSQPFDDSLPKIYSTDGRMYIGRSSLYNGASLNAISAIEEGRLPLRVLHKLFGATGEHCYFIDRLFSDDSATPEWHHLGKKANEVYFQNRDTYQYPITDVTIFAAKQYKRGTSEEQIKNVLNIEKDASEKIGEIGARLEKQHTRIEDVTSQERVKDEEIGKEYAALKNEMRHKYLKVSKEEWNDLRNKVKELSEKMYSWKDVTYQRKRIPTDQEVAVLLKNDSEAVAIEEKAKKDILIAFNRKTEVPITLNEDAAQEELDKLIIDNVARRSRFSIANQEWDKLEEYFGTTTDAREAGYILPNGKMLDLSGVSQGYWRHDGARHTDHREVASVLDGRGYDYVWGYVQEMMDSGAIRTAPEMSSLGLTRDINPLQESVIYDWVDGLRDRGNPFIVEMYDGNGVAINTQEFNPKTSARAIIDAIHKFYKDVYPNVLQDIASTRFSFAEDAINGIKSFRYKPIEKTFQANNTLYPNLEDIKNEAVKDQLELAKSKLAEAERIYRENSQITKLSTISSVTDAASVDPSTINLTQFSITNDGDLRNNILNNYVGSTEAKRLGWNKEQIEGAIEGTFEVIAGIHAVAKSDKNYFEASKAVPTIRTDWRDGKEKPIVSWVRGNIEYKYDMSADTLCINNEGLEQMLSNPAMADLMIAFSEDTEYGSEDYLRLYETLRDMGYVVPCKGCFDAAMRMKMLPSVAQNFIAEVNSVIDERNANPKKFDASVRALVKEGKNKSIEDLPLTSGNKSVAIRVGVAGDKLTKRIDWTQLMSAKGQTKALMDWGGIFRAWQKTGAGRPKDKLLPEAYSGVIISTTTTIIGKAGENTPSFRDLDVNQGTGLRRNSHSEFRPTLIVDEIQFLRDCWLKGLCVFKYMKELDDVRLFGRMGIKYNMSAFPAFDSKGTAAGLDKNGNYIWAEESVGGREFEYKGRDGKIHYDGAKGLEEAKKYINKDVSLSCVIFSVPHLIKAMTDVPTKKDKRGMFGSLIGFHNSGADAKALEIQGLGKERACLPNHNPFEVEAMSDYNLGVTNFEQVQNDRFGKGWKVLKGKEAGTDVKFGHKLEFVNGTVYRNDKLGITLYSSKNAYNKEKFKIKGPIYTLDKENNKIAHSLNISYNDKVRELGGDYAYQDAADFYIKELSSIGLIPRFDFSVPADIFVKMCKDANVDPHHPKLGWKGKAWSPINSDAYYSLFCDFGMTDPTTGKWSPHLPVLDGVRNKDAFKDALPKDYLTIIKDGLKKYTKRKDREDKMDREAMLEYCRRSIQAGKTKAEKVRKILAKHGYSAREIASIDVEFSNAKNLGKKASPSASTSRFSLSNNNAEGVAALIGAVGILKGENMSDRTLDAIRKSTMASISIPDLRHEAERLANENRKVLNYIAHDKQLDKLIARAGMADRLQKVIDRSRQADFDFVAGVQRKTDVINRVNERIIRDTKGLTADTILNEYGIDPASLMLALRPAENAPSIVTEPTQDSQGVDMPHSLDATMMNIAQQRAQELVGRAKEAVTKAKTEQANNPLEIDEDGNRKSKNTPNENDPDVMIGTMLQDAIIAEIKKSGISIDNAAEMVKLAEVITEDYIKNHPAMYQGINLDNIWEDPRARALLGGNISRFAQMVASAYCPTYTRERVLKKAQMLDDKAIRRLETIEEVGVHIFENLNKDIVRESRKSIINQIHKKIDRLSSKHNENTLNEDRKVSSAMSAYLKKVKKAIDMTAQEVEDRIAELENLCTSRYQGIDEDTANHYRDYQEAQDEIYILSYWGNLKSKMPSELKADFECLDQAINEDVYRMMQSREEYIKRIDDAVSAMAGGIAPDPKNKGKKPTKDSWAYSVVGMLEPKYRQYIRFCKDPVAAQKAREAFAQLEQMINDSLSAETNFVLEFREKLKNLLDDAYGSVDNARKALSEVYDAPWYWVKLEGDTNPQVEDDVGVTAKRALQMYVSIVQDDYIDNVQKWGRDGEYRAKLEKMLGLVDENGNYNADAPHAKFIEGLRALYLEMGSRLDEVLVETTGTHLRTPNRNYMPVKMDRRIKRGKNGEGRAFSPFAPSLTPRIKNGRDFDQTADIKDIFLERLSDSAHTIGWAKTGPIVMKMAQSDAIINTIENHFGNAEAKRWNNYIFDIVAGPKASNLKESESMKLAMRYASLLWLGCNLGSWAKQLTSIPCLALSNCVSFRDVASSLSMWALHPIQMCRVAYDLANSDAYKSRYGTAISNELRYAISDDGGFATWKSCLVKGIMSGVVGADKLGVLMCSGLYFRRRQQLEQQGHSAQDASRLAADWMMAIVDKTMQSGRTVNLTEAQRNGGLSAFIQFKSAPMQQAQFEMVAFEEWAADKTNGEKFRTLVKTIVINHMAVPFGMALIDAAMAFLTSWGVPDEEKRERLYARIVGEILGGPFSSLFFIGAFVEYGADVIAQLVSGSSSKVGGGVGQLVPAEGAIEFMAKNTEAIIKALENIDQAEYIDTMAQIGMAVGNLTPGLSWMTRTGKKMYDSINENPLEKAKRERNRARRKAKEKIKKRK